MNRNQRRSAKHHGTQAVARATFEEVLRRDLRGKNITLVAIATGENAERETLFLIQVLKGDVLSRLSIRPMSPANMATAIEHALSGERVDVVLPPQGPSAPATVTVPREAPAAIDPVPLAAIEEIIEEIEPPSWPSWPKESKLVDGIPWTAPEPAVPDDMSRFLVSDPSMPRVK